MLILLIWIETAIKKAHGGIPVANQNKMTLIDITSLKINIVEEWSEGTQQGLPRKEISNNIKHLIRVAGSIYDMKNKPLVAL